MAALLSIFIPGLGHLCVGRPFAAIIWFMFVPFSWLVGVFGGLGHGQQHAGFIALLLLGPVAHLACILSAHGSEQEQLIRNIRRGVRR